MNLSSVVSFIEQLEKELSLNPQAKIIYCVASGKRALTNASFLLGCYMMLKLNMSSREVSETFDWLDETNSEAYRDATFDPGSFRLTLDDCWLGIERGRDLGWFQASVDNEIWGQVNIHEYRHYDDPCNGDFHEVVPGKFIAFKGPVDLADGAAFTDDAGGFRVFAPDTYAGIFAEDFGVVAAVRLNEARYDPAAFERRGIRHHHLEFDDCACPPPAVAAAFLAAAASAIDAGGSVAVHCKAGLGRTGTLIALYLTRSEGFSARAAMGWLRIMRPGSVIGRQQDYLCACEPSIDMELGPAGVCGAASDDSETDHSDAGEERERDGLRQDSERRARARARERHLAAEVGAAAARREAARRTAAAGLRA
jgi:cell division cycle 14